jgi:hypothetical protein
VLWLNFPDVVEGHGVLSLILREVVLNAPR